MADQCIVCLENLDVEPGDAAPLFPSAAVTDGSSSEDSLPPGTTTTPPEEIGITNTTIINTTEQSSEDHENVAVIQACKHILHDTCLRAWSSQANSCPICRQTFNLVHVFDRVGG